MKLNARQNALATQCLWGLQENAPDVEGIALASIGGILLAATITPIERAQRLAALAAALFLLGEHAAALWGRGATFEVRVALGKRGQDTTRVSLKPVGAGALVIVVWRMGDEQGQSANLALHLEKAVPYLEALLAGETPPDWLSP
ncbi:MAG: roadblock/LC7 domain-containing protein [Chloroflexi bacterium]|nr:roadblock/LC7 domain-containing protein [Chloroflexota bacterium]